MDRSRVTIRYARALLELANEQQVLERTDHDIRLITQIMLENKGLTAYLNLPKLPSVEKHRKISSLFDPLLAPLTRQFLKMVFKNGRESFLLDICRNFIRMAKQARNIISAQLTLAEELDPEIVRKINQAFEEQLHSTIELETRTDPDIIGGFVFSINGWQYDASLATRLKTLQKQLQL